MTQLMQRDYARKMKFKIDDLPRDKYFSIVGPGGGRNKVTQRVTITVNVMMERCLSLVENYVTGERDLKVSEPEEKSITMTFGLVDSLPVPILWGGGQMRKRDLMDDHGRKTLSLLLDNNERWQMPSLSWLVSCAQMKLAVEENKAVYAPLIPFIPSRELLSGMIKGERMAYNLPGMLAPRRSTVLKVSRHNARVDEGFNDVEVMNAEEIQREWGSKIEVWPSSSTGEAHIIIHNFTDVPMFFPAGKIQVVIRPALAIPIINYSTLQGDTDDESLAAKESDISSLFTTMNDETAIYPMENKVVVNKFKNWSKSKRKFTVPNWDHRSTYELRDAGDMPTSFYSWNLNGLNARMKQPDFHQRFLDHLEDQEPDVVALLEVKLRCDGDDQGRVLCGSEDEATWNNFYEPIAHKYEAYMSLCAKKYSGTVVLCKRVIAVPEVCYNFGDSLDHHPEGRFIRLDFKDISVTSVYVPFNGAGDPVKLLRRQEWDKQFCEEVSRNSGPQTPRVYMGDFNVAINDHDLSPDPNFWFKQGPQDLPDIGDVGFGGTTANERLRAQEILKAGDLMDTFEQHKLKSSLHRSRQHNFTFRGTGKLSSKGGRFDYIFVDSTILVSGGVRCSYIMNGGSNPSAFMGSDHAPVVMSLENDWRNRLKTIRSIYLRWEEARNINEVSTLNAKSSNWVDLEDADETDDDLDWENDAMTIQEKQDVWNMFTNPKSGILGLGKTVKPSQLWESSYKYHNHYEKQARVEEVKSRLADSTDLLAMSTMGLGESAVRPELFPEELWKLVDPREKDFVEGRFKKFISHEYLLECVNKILNDLDIYKSDIKSKLPWLDQFDDNEESEEQIFRAQALANIDVYFFADPDNQDFAKGIQAPIHTVDDKPFKCKPRKLSVVQQAFLLHKTNIMLRYGKLEHSSSNWCHGLVLVPYDDRIQSFMDKHGEKAMEEMFKPEHEAEVSVFFRFCIDLRMLNLKTVPDLFPLPRIDDLIDSIPRGCSRYSISDVTDAFFTCQIAPEHRYKTAFKTHDRQLQFSVLPQGFINSPGIFCRMIQETFEGMDRNKFSAYVDDLLNHANEFGDHFDTQQEIYRRLRTRSLTIKLTKTHLNYPSVKFLGHILCGEGRLPDPEAVEAIAAWKNPETAKEVRSFLGATLYYREYIYQYSSMAMPLYELIRKGVVVKDMWKDKIHGVAVQQIKDALITKPVLMNIDTTKPFRLKIDACRAGRGIGCILEQQNNEGKWNPVSYYSSSLSKEERNYSATELECKALHDCILHYATFLKYIPHFEVFSDHNALRYMVNSENSTTNGRLMRYLLDLQGFRFSLYYRRGTENCDADAVSRLLRRYDEPVILGEETLDDHNGVVSTEKLQRARKLDQRNKEKAKEAESILRKIDKKRLNNMSKLNDYILAEGVEQLETESGREKFLENLKKIDIHCDEETLKQTITEMNLIPSYVKEQVDVVATLVSNMAMPKLICDDLEEEEFDENLLSELNVVHESSYFYEEGYVDAVTRMYSTEEPVFPGYDHDDTRLDDNSLVADSEFFVPFALENLVEDMTTSDESPSFEMTEAEIVELCYLRNEVKSRAIQAFEENLGDRRIRERNDWESLGLTLDKKMSLAATRLQRKKEESSQESDSSEEFTEESGSVPVGDEEEEASSTHSYALRPRRVLHYSEEEKIAPNWKEKGIEACPPHEYINQRLNELHQKWGKGRVEVRKSLLDNAGWGLFALKDVNEVGTVLCSYEGDVMSELEYNKRINQLGTRDYVMWAVKNVKTKEKIYVDSREETSCFGRFINDPIDDHLVNARVKWNGKRMVVVTTVPGIKAGDEIYIGYSDDYWGVRLNYLSDELKERIEENYRSKKDDSLSKKVIFDENVEVAKFVEDEEPTDIEISTIPEPLRHIPENLITRVRKSTDHIDFDASAEENREERVKEEFMYENMYECEQLAEEIAPLLNGKRFQDGPHNRLYEIYGIRYDEKYQAVIGWRKPLSGKMDKEDDSAFCVFGKDGLYELHELYLVNHPEDRDDVVWPADNSAWAQEQLADPELVSVINKVLDTGGDEALIRKDSKGYGKVRLGKTGDGKNSLLLRVYQDKRRGERVMIMVPRHLVKKVLKVHHEGYAHMGINRMVETIKLRYYWKGMDNDVKEHTSNCISCKLRKTYQRRPQVPIMKYNAVSYPLDRVHIDLTGPLPATQNGNRYIMVIKDYLTKYVWLMPLQSKTAVEIAENFVTKFVCQAGIPDMVVSDRGNEFVNSLLANVSKILGINRISTTPYNPRSDGFVENHNKTLKDQLFNYIDTLRQNDWDLFLPTVQLMYNTTVSLSTGYTPMLLMTGREGRMPSLNHMETVVGKLQPEMLNNDYVRGLVDSMRRYHEDSVGQTEKNKLRFNVRVKQPLEFVEYEVGQKFMLVKRPVSEFKSIDEEQAYKISMKLLERYEGPYVIVNKINPILYDANIEGVIKRVHAIHMKPY